VGERGFETLVAFDKIAKARPLSVL